MHSSTSSSDARPNRACKADFVVAAILVGSFCLLAELGTWLVFDRFSGGQIALNRELAELHASRAAKTGGPPTILLVGNSLLDQDVDFPALETALAPRWAAERLVVVDTQYLDWWYGLRRLFAEGARPAVVVVLLSPRQLMSQAVRGDYFAHYLMRSLDVVSVARDTRAHPTVATGMLFANFSRFYGVRSEIRKRAISVLIPKLPQLTAILLQGAPQDIDEARLTATALARLAALKGLAAEYGSKLVFVVPPTPSDVGRPGCWTIRDAGLSVGVPVLAIGPGEMVESDYADGLHLNAEGARKFTPRLVAMLEDRLGP